LKSSFYKKSWRSRKRGIFGLQRKCDSPRLKRNWPACQVSTNGQVAGRESRFLVSSFLYVII